MANANQPSNDIVNQGLRRYTGASATSDRDPSGISTLPSPARGQETTSITGSLQSSYPWNGERILQIPPIAGVPPSMSTSERPNTDHSSTLPRGETVLSSSAGQLSDEQRRARARKIGQRMRALQQEMEDLGIAPERAPSAADRNAQYFGGETSTSAHNLPTILHDRQNHELSSDEPPPSYDMVRILG